MPKIPAPPCTCRASRTRWSHMAGLFLFKEDAMCRFKSAIITRTEVLHDLDSDSHEELITKYKLNDRTITPDFVRVEMTQVDDDIFNHARGNWLLKIDQDLRPDWFDEAEAAEAMWRCLEQTFSERFVMSGK